MTPLASPEPKERRRLVRPEDEAVVPDQLTREEFQRRIFIDNNSYRRPEDLLDVFNYSGYFTPFTTEEELVFAQAFKKTPKNFGAIAESLPGRTLEDCVKHYNAKKGDGRFKSQTELQWTKKQAMKESMYAYEDDGPPPPPPKPVVSGKKGHLIDEYIKKLRSELEEQPQSLYTQKARAGHKAVTLARPDLTYVRKGFRAPLDIGDDRIIKFLRLASVLPLIKQWALICIDNPRFRAEMEEMLPSGFSWDTQLKEIAYDALLHKDSEFKLDQVLNYCHVYVLTANWAYKIAASNKDYFESGLFKPYGFDLIDRMTVGVAALFTAYDEVTQKKDNSFFVALLASPLAKSMYREVRETWEAKYKFEGEKELDPPVNRDIGPRPGSQLPAFQPPSQPSGNTSTQHDFSARSRNHQIDPMASIGEEDGSEEDGGSEGDWSESDEEIGEPVDEAGRMYKAKAEGLYNAVKKMATELKQVTAERDHYKAQYEKGQEKSKKDEKGGERKRTKNLGEPELSVMAKANNQLHLDHERLQDSREVAFEDEEGKLAIPIPARLGTEEVMRAFAQAEYESPLD